MNPVIGTAGSVWIPRLPREASSAETRAMVILSGAQVWGGIPSISARPETPFFLPTNPRSLSRATLVCKSGAFRHFVPGKSLLVLRGLSRRRRHPVDHPPVARLRAVSRALCPIGYALTPPGRRQTLPISSPVPVRYTGVAFPPAQRIGGDGCEEVRGTIEDSSKAGPGEAGGRRPAAYRGGDLRHRGRLRHARADRRGH